VPFAVFGTAGTEDFNHLEMRKLDRALKSAHRVAIFEGGHTWPPPELAMEAIGWMETEAMKSGIRSQDSSLLENLFRGRLAAADAAKNPKEACLRLEALAVDFAGLRDVSAVAARVAELQKQKSVKDALKKERDTDDREDRLTGEMVTLETQDLAAFKDRFRAMARKANAPEDSDERRMYRRMLRGLAAGLRESGITDPELGKLLEEFRRR
jgi:hypothetical protein